MNLTNTSPQDISQNTLHPGIKSAIEKIKQKEQASNITPYYPLPSNEGYEKFLSHQKKDIYYKTQYSINFLLSVRQKYTEKPTEMNEIKIQLKSEGRSRAKIVTDEAFRETRNYIKIQNPNSMINQTAFSQLQKKFAKKQSSEKFQGDIQAKLTDLREVLNKITFDNMETNINYILKFEYNEEIIENFRNILYYKAINESKYFDLYIKICLEMFKLYNRKSHPSNPEMNFQSLMLKKCKEEFYNPNDTKLSFPFVENEEEKNIRKIDAKYGNVRLIAEFFLNNVLPFKVINECIDFLIVSKSSNKEDGDFYIRCLCELLKKCIQKICNEDVKRVNYLSKVLEEY